MPWSARTGSEGKTIVNPVIITSAAVLALVVLLALTHVPLGNWIYRVFTDDKDWRVERGLYRVIGVDPRTEQRWTGYAVSVVSFAVVSVAAVFLLIEVQGWLPWSQGRSMDWHTAFNTAVSFMSNTNWQSYAGEAGAGYTVNAVGLTVQNFASAAVGLAVAVALIRGLARQSTDRIGNFWVDLVRGTIRILLPMAVVAAIVLLVAGVIQNLTDPTTVTTVTGDPAGHPGRPGRLAGGHQGARHQRRRLLQRQLCSPVREPQRARPTCSRSSCCWSSPSRCRTPTGGWWATSARASSPPPRWPACSPRA